MAPVSGGLAGNSPPVITQSRGTCRGCFAAAGKGPHLGRMPMGTFHMLGEQEELKSKDSAPVSSRENPTAAGRSLELQSLPHTTARALLPFHCACGHGLSHSCPSPSAGMPELAPGDPRRTRDRLWLTTSRCPDHCLCDSSRRSPTPCHPCPAAGGPQFHDAHKEKNMFSIRATLNIH